MFIVFVVWWPWKLDQGHQNLIKSLNHPSNTIDEVWPESVIWFKRQGTDTLILVKIRKMYSLYSVVTLKILVKVTKIYSNL